ncbi:Exodeoxyribonuclease VII small subunit [Saccharicrinis carchari]|uniref:Exodeoxyribonuclease VII small subunit n=1 Tax=Saccharicrinis carchari TaxID=1168039 RepID=A0A521EAL4_SACCC|nr:exodeoxyribonuclease VII small subunit [Saccharicrinis carchari]SMO80953.1 Exodeoxyribonuclease VII small subunit [Saccharicrinis carchari]
MTKKKVSYVDAIAEIENILEKIEDNSLDVDELAEQVKRVSVLLKICKEKLHNTEIEVENILKEIEE